MALGVVVISVLSMFAIVIAWGAFAPTFQTLGTDIGKAYENNPCGANSTEQRCIARDTTYKSILVLPLFMIAIVGAFMFLTLTRKDTNYY